MSGGGAACVLSTLPCDSFRSGGGSHFRLQEQKNSGLSEVVKEKGSAAEARVPAVIIGNYRVKRECTVGLHG